MSIIVQKFGGSSVGSPEKLLHISHIIRAARDEGRRVIAVVSAQGGTTNRLIEKARELSPAPPARELDALLASGEQVSAALTAIALETLGVPAVSLNAWQAQIHSDSRHGDARIVRIRRERIEQELARGRVAVCTGFQGVDGAGDITTLGRGGSDYSAAALAAEFGAETCRIYTDVDGVYTADPRICPRARRIERLAYEDMYALARSGAQVLHDKCVALAQEHNLTLEVLSCDAGSAGTLIGAAGDGHGIAGAALRPVSDEESAVTLAGAALPSLAAQKSAVLALNAAGIPLRGTDTGERTLTLIVGAKDAEAALRAVHDAVLA